MAARTIPLRSAVLGALALIVVQIVSTATVVDHLVDPPAAPAAAESEAVRQITTRQLERILRRATRQLPDGSPAQDLVDQIDNGEVIVVTPPAATTTTTTTTTTSPSPTTTDRRTTSDDWLPTLTTLLGVGP